MILRDQERQGSAREEIGKKARLGGKASGSLPRVGVFSVDDELQVLVGLLPVGDGADGHLGIPGSVRIEGAGIRLRDCRAAAPEVEDSIDHARWRPRALELRLLAEVVHGRLDDLHALAEGAGGFVLSRRLLHALLEELHISDDFDALVGRVARLPASQYPRLLAIALLLRHSWCPQDLVRAATRLGLPRLASLTPDTRHTPRDGGHRRRAAARTPLLEPRTR